jgi:hypothetical protein
MLDRAEEGLDRLDHIGDTLRIFPENPKGVPIMGRLGGGEREVRGEAETPPLEVDGSAQ